MAREKEVMRCGLCGKRISGRNGGVYCASCSRRLAAGESVGAIMAGAKDVEPVGDGTKAQEAERRRTMCDPCWNNQHEKCTGGACKCVSSKHGRSVQTERRAKDARPDPVEAERWKRHMHEDGLWCGDVNCKTCAKSGAMAKGVKEMKKAKDAEVQPVKYNAEAVQKEINKDKRVGGKEAKAIHALLKGRTGDDFGPYTAKIEEARRQQKRAKQRWEDDKSGKRRDTAAWHDFQHWTKEVANLIGQARGTRSEDANNPFERDTDAGAERIVRREAKAGLTAAQIARKHGFSLSFVKEVLNDVKPVGDALNYRWEVEIKFKSGGFSWYKVEAPDEARAKAAGLWNAGAKPGSGAEVGKVYKLGKV